MWNYYAGPYAGDPAGLPGDEAGPLLGGAANMTAQMAQQKFLQDYAALGAFGNAAGGIANPASNPNLGLSNMISQNLLQDPYTTSSDELQGEIEGLLKRQFATAREGGLGQLSDAAAASGMEGGESALLRSGADFGTRAALADALAESRVGQAVRRQTDQKTAMDMAGQGGQNLLQQQLGPLAMNAQALTGYTNPYFDSTIDQTRALGMLAIEDALREAYGGSSGLNSWGPQVGAIMGGAGDLFGGLFGNKGIMGALGIGG